MARTCTLCSHPDRAEIDRALIRCEPLRHIASQYGTSTGTLQRHKAEHLPVLVAEHAEKVRVEVAEYASDVLADILDTRETAKRGAIDALGAGRFAGGGTLLAVRLKANELLAELEGKLSRTPQVNLAVQVYEALVEVLPAEILPTVAERLERLGGGA